MTKVDSLTMRQTHVNLWRGIMGFGIMGVAIGLTALDNPYLPFGMPKWSYCGSYVLIGLIKILFVNLPYRTSFNLKVVRVSMSVGIFISLSYGIGFLIGYFQTSGRGLLQLAIYSFFLGIIQFAPLLEPAFNPITATETARDKLGDA